MRGLRDQWHARFGGIFGVYLLAVTIGDCADLHTEQFNGGQHGWFNFGAGMNLSAVSNTLRGRFSAQGGLSFPETDSFAATNTSSSGAFVGDYPAAGGLLIGFSFLADDVLPSSLFLRWHSGGHTFIHGLSSSLANTGSWHAFRVSLRSREEGVWMGGVESQFQTGLHNVGWVDVRVTRNGAMEQDYFIDDFFIDELPKVTAIAVDGDGNGRLEISALRTNTQYDIQRSGTLNAEWTNAASVAATNRTILWDFSVSTQNANSSYRLQMSSTTLLP